MPESAWFRGEGGGLHEFDLPLPEVFAQQERAGRLVRVDPPAAAPAEPAPAAAGDDSPERPARADSKADWIAYGLRVSDLSRDDLSAMTKAELVEMFGGD